MSDDTKQDTTVEQQIRSMAKVSLFEGKLNDIQLENLRKWPLVFFNGVKEVKIKYHLGTGKVHVDTKEDPKNFDIKYKIRMPKNRTSITYWLTLDESQENLYLDKRFAGLNSAIKHLLWNGIVVKIYFNNKLVHENKNGR